MRLRGAAASRRCGRTRSIHRPCAPRGLGRALPECCAADGLKAPAAWLARGAMRNQSYA